MKEKNSSKIRRKWNLLALPQHGTWIHRKDCALTATYHPSAILRDPSKYEIAKRDFMEIVKKREEQGSIS